MKIKTCLSVLICSWLFLCSCATVNSRRLPHEVPINESAGRGGFLTVMVRFGDGEELPFFLDTGTTSTVFDKSLAPKLGEPVGSANIKQWGVWSKQNVYNMPRLYLGGLPLKGDGEVVTFDLSKAPHEAGARPYVGILGYDTLKHFCLQLDFAEGKLRFLDSKHADKSGWGKAFPIVSLNSEDSRPAVAENLLGLHGPHSLIDSGCTYDGWLMTNHFERWTNTSIPPAQGEARSPYAIFAGEKYPVVDISRESVESDGIGLRFMARHLVTLDFPHHTMYLSRRSIGPLPDPNRKMTRMKALEPMIEEVIQGDAEAVHRDLTQIEQSSDASAFEKNVALRLAATMTDTKKPVPAEVPAEVITLPLGDAQPESAEVGWLKPMANRIPPNGEVSSPLLDSGEIFATGLFAHSPSRYVFNLGGKWKHLHGQAGIHTAFQGQAYGVVFVIKADGKEVFRSDAIRGTEHPSYDVDVTGVKTLELVVEKAQEHNGGNWALWLDPYLTR